MLQKTRLNTNLVSGCRQILVKCKTKRLRNHIPLVTSRNAKKTSREPQRNPKNPQMRSKSASILKWFTEPQGQKWFIELPWLRRQLKIGFACIHTQFQNEEIKRRRVLLNMHCRSHFYDFSG